jgi:hypothetical protein
VFFLDMRQVAWDGGRVSPDGPVGRPRHGGDPEPCAAVRDFPATRIAWPGQLPRLRETAGGHGQCLFTAVIVGIVETT